MQADNTELVKRLTRYLRPYLDRHATEEEAIARAVLAAVTPQIEARVVGEICARLRQTSVGGLYAREIEHAYKESQP